MMTTCVEDPMGFGRMPGFGSNHGLGFDFPLGEYPNLRGGPWRCVVALVPLEVWVVQSSPKGLAVGLFLRRQKQIRYVI